MAKLTCSKPILKYFSDADRRNRITNSLDEKRLEKLLTILIQLASYGDRNFAIQLPHLIFNFLETAKVEEQKQLVVHAVVTASVIGAAFSAVERLLELDSDQAIQDQLQLELQYTDHLKTIALRGRGRESSRCNKCFPASGYPIDAEASSTLSRVMGRLQRPGLLPG